MKCNWFWKIIIAFELECFARPEFGYCFITVGVVLFALVIAKTDLRENHI